MPLAFKIAGRTITQAELYAGVELARSRGASNRDVLNAVVIAAQQAGASSVELRGVVTLVDGYLVTRRRPPTSGPTVTIRFGQ